MKTKKLLHKILYVVAAFLLSLFVVFEYTFSKAVTVSAETAMVVVTYTPPLSDLRTDENFDETAYPAVESDSSLSVIQIAESTSGELFLYVYQPCHDTLDLVATRTSMYLGESVNGKDFSPELFHLRLVGTQGVFDKYVVEGVTVSKDLYRYYNIVSIYREFNEAAGDRDIGIGSTAEVAYSVGQQWCAYSKNGVRTYEMNTFKVLDVEVTANGFVYFQSGFQWGNFIGRGDECDAHFICFNFSEFDVDRIYDAYLMYDERRVEYSKSVYQQEGTWAYDEYVTKRVTLTDVDKVEYSDGGIFEKRYTWNRINSSSNFVEQIESQNGVFNEVDRETILSSQWVFAFCETDRKHIVGTEFYQLTTYDVDDVAILRISFHDVSGETYNLGVVANITDSADEPSGTVRPDNDTPDWVYLLVGGLLLILGVVALVFLGLYGGPALKVIWKVICLPFKLIGALFKGIGKLFKGKK